MAQEHSHDHAYLHEHNIPHLHHETDVHDADHNHEHAHSHDHAEGHGHVHENTQAVLNRLSRAIGHLESVRKMVENGRDCSEVLIQIAAVRAAITNIADDHLDWHGGIENYAADKAKVFHNVKKALVYNADDERVTKLAFAAQTAPECRRIGFTLAEPKDGQIGVKDGWIVDMSGIAGGEAGKPFQVAKVTDFTHLTEPDGTVYPHLLADALTALALVLGLGADKDKALAALKQFTPGGHRIQTVAVAKTSDGGTIRFVDDSKATNAHAAKASLNSFADKSVVWIAGGLAKGSRFEQLVADQARTIKAAIIIGKDQQPMLDAFKASAPDIPMSVIDPMDNDTVMARAIDAAGTYAQSGDVVLMAPACASMDQFKSYADRGNQFAQQAQRWVNEHGEA